MTYAANTDVSVERSRNELERTLARYGATRFGYMTEVGQAVVMFETSGRRVRFHLPLPDRNDRRFTHTEARETERTAAQAEASWEQACRQRWRALNLAVKTKLEAVEAGIATFEEEFASFIVLPNQQTVGQWLIPQIKKAYETQQMPPMLQLGPSSAGDSKV